MSETLITRDKLQEDLEDLYNYKIKPYLNGEGRTVLVRNGFITKESPVVTFRDLPVTYESMFDVYTSVNINYVSVDRSVPGECTVTYDANDIDAGQEIEVVLRTEMLISTGTNITGIAITHMPRKLTYNKGYELDLNEIEITGYFSDGVSNNITSGIIFNPPDKSVLTELGDNTITCTFHDFTTSFNVRVADREILVPLSYHFIQGVAVVYHNEIHLFGAGYNDSTGSKYHYKWDGENWSQVSVIPYEIHDSNVIVYNDEIHLIGGNYRNSYSQLSNYYKHIKWNGEEWIILDDLPANLVNSPAVVYNNKIYILGGYAGYTACYTYDGTSWRSEETTLPYYSYNSSAVVYNNEIHIFGSSYYDNRNDCRFWHGVFDGEEWRILQIGDNLENPNYNTLPYGFYNGSAVVFDNKIHLLGGANDYTAHYSWDGEVWKKESVLPRNFYNRNCYHAVVWNKESGEEIILIGYYDSTSGSSSDRQTYGYFSQRVSQYDGVNWINCAYNN